MYLKNYAYDAYNQYNSRYGLVNIHYTYLYSQLSCTSDVVQQMVCSHLLFFLKCISRAYQREFFYDVETIPRATTFIRLNELSNLYDSDRCYVAKN